jgi:hypothetical protein
MAALCLDYVCLLSELHIQENSYGKLDCVDNWDTGGDWII